MKTQSILWHVILASIFTFGLIRGQDIESFQSTAGVIVALPNAFFESITGQFIEVMENKMNKEGFSLGTLRT